MSASSISPFSRLPNKVFITGANGFIGRRLAHFYRERGVAVAGVDFRADAEWNVVAGDVGEPASWKAALAGCDVVINTAAIVSMTASMADAWRVNVQGTRRVLEAARDAGVTRFVQLSSIAAFGWDYPDQATEDYPLKPNGNTYCDSKIASEHVVLAAHARGEIEGTVIRPGDVYGPASKPWTLLPLELLRSGQFLLPDRGRGVFSPVYVDDLVDGIALAVAAEAGKGQIFTLTSGEGVSCMSFFMHHARWAGQSSIRTVPKALAVVLAEAIGRAIRATGKPSEMGRGGVDILSRTHSYSIAKAQAMLGYAPKVSLAEGMRRTEAWLRDEGLI